MLARYLFRSATDEALAGCRLSDLHQRDLSRETLGHEVFFGLIELKCRHEIEAVASHAIPRGCGPYSASPYRPLILTGGSTPAIPYRQGMNAECGKPSG